MSIESSIKQVKAIAPIDFAKVSRVGVITMIVSVSVMSCSLLMSFVLPQYFTLLQQTIAHVVTIFAAGFIKVGYVAYIVGRYERKLAY